MLFGLTNTENLEKVISAAGIKPNKQLIMAFLSTGVSSHLMYVYAYYYLLALGNDPTVEGIMRIAKEFGIAPDAKRIKEALVFISTEY